MRGSRKLAQILKDETLKAVRSKRKREEDEEEVEDPEKLCDDYVEQYWDKLQKRAKSAKFYLSVKEPKGKKRAAAVKRELEKDGFNVHWNGNMSRLSWDKVKEENPLPPPSLNDEELKERNVKGIGNLQSSSKRKYGQERIYWQDLERDPHILDDLDDGEPFLILQ